MLIEPNCYKRQCKHYQGIKWLGEEESTEVNYCPAFPQDIPQEIAYGPNEHETPCCGQENEIVYEKE
jgi:hypothetical protein